MSNKAKNTKVFIFKTIALVMAICMVASVFLPYFSMKKEYADAAKMSGNIEMISGINANDLVDISMFEFVKVLNVVGEYDSSVEIAAIFCTVLFCAICLFALLTFLFALLGKPIPMLIFDIITSIFFFIQSIIYSGAGVAANSTYNMGIGHYLFIVALVLIFVCSICMMVFRNSGKTEKYPRVESV